MTVASAPSDSRKKARSRVSNGTDILPGIDGALADRPALSGHLRANISRSGRSRPLGRNSLATDPTLCRGPPCWPNRLEARLASGEQIDVAEHALLTSNCGAGGKAHRINRSAREIVQA